MDNINKQKDIELYLTKNKVTTVKDENDLKQFGIYISSIDKIVIYLGMTHKGERVSYIIRNDFANKDMLIYKHITNKNKNETYKIIENIEKEIYENIDKTLKNKIDEGRIIYTAKGYAVRNFRLLIGYIDDLKMNRWVMKNRLIGSEGTQLFKEAIENNVVEDKRVKKDKLIVGKLYYIAFHKILSETDLEGNYIHIYYGKKRGKYIFVQVGRYLIDKINNEISKGTMNEKRYTEIIKESIEESREYGSSQFCKFSFTELPDVFELDYNRELSKYRTDFWLRRKIAKVSGKLFPI